MDNKSQIRILTVSTLLIWTLALLPAGAQSTPPVATVPPGGSASGDAEYEQEGTYCTSSSTPASKNHLAVARANQNFKDWVNSTHRCGARPEGQSSEALPLQTDPDPPFEEGDCTFSYESGCQGNPLKTLVTATCTADVSWTYECSECS